MKPVNRDKNDLLVEIALLKYKFDLSQAEIAKRLDISAMHVSRLLEKARKAGIVKIEVNTGILTDSALETKLAEKYGLKHAIVVNTSQMIDPIDALVRAAALYIDLIVEPGAVVGIAGGRTVMKLIPHLKLPLIKGGSDIEVVQLTGGMLNSIAGNPVSSLHELASRFNAKGYFLNTPIYVSKAIIQNYLDTAGFDKINELWRRCSICIGSVGALGKDFVFSSEVTISSEQIEEAAQKGAVGNVFGRWFDENGEYIDCELNEMVISLPPDVLMKIPNRVLVSGDYGRIKAVRAVLQKNIYNICVLTHNLAVDLV